MTDRLKWQFELYKNLADTIPMPVVYDLIKDEGFTLLVMQYVNGSSLHEKAEDSNPFCKTAHYFYPKLSLLIGYGIEISKILAKLHKKGYVHRDVIPVNFLVDKKNRVFLIDMELAYCMNSNKPNPPFTLGTSGFMSPEQELQQNPSYKQDIYSLGATLLCLITGLTPVKFNTKNGASLRENLEFFIPSRELSSIIADTLLLDPEKRPEINIIIENLQTFLTAATARINAEKQPLPSKLDISKLTHTILASLKGLTQPPILLNNNLWCSKRLTAENYLAPQNRQYTHSPGLSEGIAGTMYVLARIQNAGVSIDHCKTIYKKGWEYLEERYLHTTTKLPFGLHRGYAGLVLTLAQGIRAGAITNPELYEKNVYQFLTARIDRNDIAQGIAGQGIALLRCEPLLKPETIQNLLETIIDRLLFAQQANGNWIQALTAANNSRKQILDLSYDDTGILYFLLEYFARYKDKNVYNGLCKGLQRIVKNKSIIEHFYSLTATRESYQFGDGGKGMIILFLKAYEILNDKTYKVIAEKALSKYPRCVINTNFTQQNGLAGLGELYLEAWRILNNEEWKIRADWLANVFLHSFIETQDDQSGFWQMEENNLPTADFLTGISGILHFLGRCLNPSKIGYRLLS